MATPEPAAVVLTLYGVIGPAAADYVVRGLATAAERLPIDLLQTISAIAAKARS